MACDPTEELQLLQGAFLCCAANGPLQMKSGRFPGSAEVKLLGSGACVCLQLPDVKPTRFFFFFW